MCRFTYIQQDFMPINHAEWKHNKLPQYLSRWINRYSSLPVEHRARRVLVEHRALTCAHGVPQANSNI